MKKNHTHKTIFTWFGNLPTSTELQGFHYYQGKIQSAATVFLVSQERQQQKNSNHQKQCLHHTHKIHNGL